VDGWEALLQPGADSLCVGDATLVRGSRVMLRPRGDDPFARALHGREGRVDMLVEELDGSVQLAVVLDDDEARDLGPGRQLGHRFFFRPSEVEPLDGGAPAARVLVAGIGNVFLGDDGFGVEVVRRLAARALPRGVDVIEFGIRGMDLAYALGDGYDVALLVDATARGDVPGTLSVIEPRDDQPLGPPVEGHAMDPVRVLALARRLGREPSRTLVVACEPDTIVDSESGELLAELSPRVAAAVEPAVALVLSLAEEYLAPHPEVRSP